MQRRLGAGCEALGVGVRRQAFELGARYGRMLDVALGVEREVLGRRALLESVVLDQAGQLRARDRGLGRLDRVEDGEVLEVVVA